MPEQEKPILPEEHNLPEKQSRNVKEQFRDFYYDTIPYFTVNLAWFVMSLPVVTIFPALGGLYYAVLSIEQENSASWGTFWEGFKKHWWLSLRWGVLVLAVDILLAGNIWFYLNLEQSWAVIALVIVLVITLLWIAINQFSFPLLLLQEDKKIFLAIRNSYVVVMRHPMAALKVLLLTLLIAAVSILLPPLLIFISMALIVRIRTRTVLKTIQKIKQKDAERDEVKAHREGENRAKEDAEGKP